MKKKEHLPVLGAEYEEYCKNTNRCIPWKRCTT